MSNLVLIILLSVLCFKLGYDVSDILMAYDEIDVCLNRKYETESIDEKMECEEIISDNEYFIKKTVRFSVFNVGAIWFIVYTLVKII